MALSTVPAGVVTEALAYLREGGSGQPARAGRLPVRHGAARPATGSTPPQPLPAYGVHGDRRRRTGPADGRRRLLPGARAVRQHRLRRRALPTRLEAAARNALPVYCGSLRGLDPTSAGRRPVRPARASATRSSPRVLAAGGISRGGRERGRLDDAWDAGALAALDVPVIQGLVPDRRLASSWLASDAALQPDGRGDAGRHPGVRRPPDHGPVLVQGVRRRRGSPVYAPTPSGRARLAGHRGRARPAAARRPPRTSGSRSCCRRTRPSTRGSATRSGWTRPASAVVLLGAAARGRVRPRCDCELPRRTATTADPHADRGRRARRRVADRGAAAPPRSPGSRSPTTRSWFGAAAGIAARRQCASTGAQPPGLALRRPPGRAAIVLAALRFGNVVLMIQPPRGFGENPVAIYHDPDLPPSHHYLAAYRWLEAPRRRLRRARRRPPGQARHAGVAAGQGPRAVGRLRAGRGARRPAAGLPVHRQRPGRGHPGQAARPRRRRRPPGAADGPRRDLRRHGQAGAAARRVRDRAGAGPGEAADAAGADLDAGPGRAAAPRPARRRERRSDDEFDEFVLHIDGYLCEIKDVQIRDGLHVLGGGAGRRGAGQPGARRPAGPPDLGRSARAARAAGGAGGDVRRSTRQALLAEPGRRHVDARPTLDRRSRTVPARQRCRRRRTCWRRSARRAASSAWRRCGWDVGEGPGRWCAEVLGTGPSAAGRRRR